MTATPHSAARKSSSSCSWRCWTPTASRASPGEGTRRVDVSDLMRRLVKEELLTFEGTRLFPERCRYTVEYELSDPRRRFTTRSPTTCARR